MDLQVLPLSTSVLEGDTAVEETMELRTLMMLFLLELLVFLNPVLEEDIHLEEDILLLPRLMVPQ
jgi:hypothetical protein